MHQPGRGQRVPHPLARHVPLGGSPELVMYQWEKLPDALRSRFLILQKDRDGLSVRLISMDGSVRAPR